MAIISLNIPDTKLSRVINGVCGNNNYQATITDAEGNETPNPETKAQFAKKVLIKFLKDNVIAYERRVAQETAEQGIDISSLDIS